MCTGEGACSCSQVYPLVHIDIVHICIGLKENICIGLFQNSYFFQEKCSRTRIIWIELFKAPTTSGGLESAWWDIALPQWQLPHVGSLSYIRPWWYVRPHGKTQTCRLVEQGGTVVWNIRSKQAVEDSRWRNFPSFDIVNKSLTTDLFTQRVIIYSKQCLTFSEINNPVKFARNMIV